MYWAREIAGWLLVAAGLYGYLLCFGVFLMQEKAMTGTIAAGIATVIFRGGLHLVRVATAARLVQQSRRAESAGK